MTDALDGVLAVDKPVGPTSHDVVARARRGLRTRRVGHTGTLDPFASGLLLLCVGPSTRLSEYLVGLDKRYEATARLGVETDSHDREGEVVEERGGWDRLGVEDLEAALAGLRGPLDQVPPVFSAKKVDGERAHRRARRGETVELEPVRVEVYALALRAWEPPHARVEVHCSSGTYVRALARDLGRTLGVGAHLTELRRTGVGRFDVGGAVSLEALDQGHVPDGAWTEPAGALAHLPRVEVDEDGERRLSHGQALDAPPELVDAGGPVAAVREGRLVAVVERSGDDLRPRKVFSAA